MLASCSPNTTSSENTHPYSQCDNRVDSQNRSDYEAIPVAEIAKTNPNQTIVQDPKATVLDAFGLSELQESQQQDIVVSCPEADLVIVTLTKTGLLDDSVAGVRDRAEFTSHPEGWELIWVGRQQKCYSGRGNTDWSTELCL